MKPKTFREIQLKYNRLYISQPKPKPLIVEKSIIALKYCMEVLLHPQKPRHEKDNL